MSRPLHGGPGRPAPAPLAASNPRVKRLRRLSGRRSVRVEEAAFVIEGPKAVGEALAAGVELEELFWAAGADPGLLARAAAAGCALHETAPHALAGALDAASPQPVAAIAPAPSLTLAGVAAAVAAAAAPFVLALVEVRDPGNAGALVRAADAAGATGVVFVGESVDPLGPKTVRASAGSLFHVPMALEAAPAAALAAFSQWGLRTVAAAAHGGVAHTSLDWTGPVALLVGNEAAGLSAEVAAGVDALASIELAGRAESLNVALAGAVLCFEALRQRRAAG
ncbi:MAG: TrmH family RNA methyltransferase [Acidimicrobiales bacterium]